jgi:hypothetical protein
MVLNREAEAFLFVQYKQNVLWNWRNIYILAQGDVKSNIITAVKNRALLSLKLMLTYDMYDDDWWHLFVVEVVTEILGNLKFQLQLVRVWTAEIYGD